LADVLKTKLNGKDWTVFPNLLDNVFVENTTDIPRKEQLCAVAFLHQKKGFDVLLKAFAMVIKDYPNLHLTIAGDGPEKANLTALIQQLNLTNHVSLLGAQNRTQVRDLMRESRCFVLSSHIETFGVVVIEALSQGTPVVATLCGGPESILTEGDGLFVKVNDEKALAKGILEFLTHPDKFDHKEIRERCIATYSEQAFVSRLRAIYEEMLDNK
jgi:rfaG protein